MAKKSAVNTYVLECIRRRRIEARLRVQDMAARTGIPLGSYSCLETGRYRINLESLFRILAVLGLQIGDVWPSPLQVPVQRVTDQFIRQTVEQSRKRQPVQFTLDDVLQSVCKVYGLTLEQLSSPSRKRDLAEARTVATILVREQPHLSLVGLSRRLNRDVSSLSHCLRRLNYRLSYDRRLKSRIQQARRKLPLERTARMLRRDSGARSANP